MSGGGPKKTRIPPAPAPTPVPAQIQEGVELAGETERRRIRKSKGRQSLILDEQLGTSTPPAQQRQSLLGN